MLSFRCCSDHAFSAQSQLDGQADVRELQLSQAFGAFIEDSTLAKRLLELPAPRKDPVPGVDSRGSHQRSAAPDLADVRLAACLNGTWRAGPLPP